MPFRQGKLRQVCRTLCGAEPFGFKGAGLGAKSPQPQLHKQPPRCSRLLSRKSPLTARHIVLLLAILALLVDCAHSLTGKQLVIDDFHAEVIVMPDSSVDVTETIHPHFYGTGWHGLYRTIPVEYVTPQGFNYSLFLSIKSITDADGRSLKYESSRERHYRKFKIYI